MLETEEVVTAAQDGTDEYGNYSNKGDMYRAGERLDDLVPRVVDHLHSTFPQYGFSPSRDTFAGGRSLLIKVIAGPAGLDDRESEDAFRDKVLGEMKRFEVSSGNVLGDHHNCNIYLSVRIDPRYHAQHAQIAEGTAVEKRMSVSEFRRTIKAGDRVVLESTDSEYANSRGAVGMERVVVQVRSGDFIVEEGGKKVYFDFPKAAAFACDGERFRISDARAGKPGGYRLYRWVRT